ncbi:MAG: hypothetical protein ACR2JU_15070 [Nocardioidaceae bacterium]
MEPLEIQGVWWLPEHDDHRIAGNLRGRLESGGLRLAYPDPRPVSSFLDTASHFQDLLSIAVGKTADFERIVIQHPGLPQLSLASTPMGDLRADVEYHARWSARSDPCPPVELHKMYFTLADLGGIEGVERWLGVAEKYRTELGRVMATRYSPAMFLEDRIMNVCAALNSFDRVRGGTGKWFKFVKHIKDCVDLAGQPFRDLIVNSPDSWAADVKDTRDDLAHHREPFRREGSVGDHLLTEQLFWLFAMCTLRLAQAPQAVFDSIAEHA